MSLRATCPSCGFEGPIDVMFVDGEAKRLAARFADFEPALGRAALGYLRLWRPAQRSLALPRAVRIVEELHELVTTGTVSRDDRTGERRRASHQVWALAIEQMLAQTEQLELPLRSHGYLRAVCYAIAGDQATVARVTPQQRVGNSPAAAREPDAHERWLEQMERLGRLRPDDLAAMTSPGAAPTNGGA